MNRRALFSRGLVFILPLPLLEACGTPTLPINPSLGDTWIRPADGVVMVYVPAGRFKMGYSVAQVKTLVLRSPVANGTQRRALRAAAEVEDVRLAAGGGGASWHDRLQCIARL